MNYRHSKIVFPLKKSPVPNQVWSSPKYANPSDDPDIREAMAFCIFQEMRALESIQSKESTPKTDAYLAEKRLVETYQDASKLWSGVGLKKKS